MTLAPVALAVLIRGAACLLLADLGASASEAQTLQLASLTVEDGLAQATVTSIVQDATGFVWLGTQEGLSRYDGRRFVTYRHDPEEPGSLANDSVTALVADPAGDLWIGTAGGLSRWHVATDTFTNWRLDRHDDSSLSADRIRALWLHSSGRLWIGTEHQGMYRLQVDSDRFDHYHSGDAASYSLPSDQILALFESRDGALWVGTQQGLGRYDRAADRFVTWNVDGQDTDQPQPPVRSMAQGPDQRLWIGTVPGLRIVDPLAADRSDRNTLPQPLRANGMDLSREVIRSLHWDHRRRLWIGTDAGLVRWDGQRLQHLQHHPNDPSSLIGNRIISLFRDRGQVLWIGCQGGVSRYWDRPFLHVSRRGRGPAELSSNLVVPFSEDARGDLWIGTLGGGLNRMDRATSTFTHYRHDTDDATSLSDDQVMALHHDQHGALWVGTMKGGLCRLPASHETSSAGRFTCFRHDPQDATSLSSDAVATILEDPQGSLWVGTMGGGLNLLSSTALLETWPLEPQEVRFRRFRHHQGDRRSLGSDSIVSLAETGSRWLWIGTLGGGLSRLDRELLDRGPLGRAPEVGPMHRFETGDGTSPGPNDDDITALHFDAGRNTLWIGTQGGGLNRLDDPTAIDGPAAFSSLGMDQGLRSRTINGLALDPQGDLWMSTNRGVDRFDPDSGELTHFDTFHGLQGLDFLLGSSYQNERGEIFFGGLNGFNIIPTAELRTTGPAPSVVLTRISTFNRDLQLPTSFFTARQVELDHSERFLTFEVAALDFVAPDKNRYRYRLRGFDEHWIDLGNENKIHFASLKPGSYDLAIQAANSEGEWNRQGVEMALRVHPPPWQTPWAYGFYGLCFAFSGLGWVRWQQRRIDQEKEAHEQLLELDRMKNEFLANTSHELRTPLHGMTGLAESLLAGQGGSISAQARDNLEMIVASGHRLSNLVNDILDLSRLQQQGLEPSLDIRLHAVHLRPLVHLAFSLTRPLIGNKPIELINRLPLGLPPALADENRVKQILINLIGNGIKFTEKGAITVSAQIHETHLTIKVEDTGIGIPKSKLKTIFEPFERVGSGPHLVQGSGLGLAISRRLVHLLDGTIWVESSLGEGSTFYFDLPRSFTAPLGQDTETEETLRHLADDIQALRHEVRAARTAEDTNTEPEKEGARILGVDDEAVNRRVMRNYLAEQHHGLTFASSGEAALQLLSEHTFDLVLLDVMMPQLSGYEVCRILRTEFALQALPVIFLTAKGQETDIMEGLGAGANDYLFKPISRGELLSRIQPHLELVKIYRKLEAQVEEKVAEVRILRGLLPVCANCKKIRDEEDRWQDLASYLDRHSEAQLSHSICPSCVTELYPDLELGT